MDLRQSGEGGPPPRPCPPRLLCVTSSGVVSLLHALGAFQLLHDANEPLPRSLGEHLLSTSALLRVTSTGDDELCDAGALHSVYGTEFFHCAIAGPLGDMPSRARVASIAGERAERLAHLFCALERPMCFLDMTRLPMAGNCISLPLRKQPGCAARVSVEDVNSLLLMEAANLLDQGGPILARVAALPPFAPLRAAVSRVWSSTLSQASSSSSSSSISSRAPTGTTQGHVEAELPSLTPPPSTSMCCPWGGWRWWQMPLRTVNFPIPPLPLLSLELPGSFLLDGSLGGPLCPPHLWPAVLIPPSPFHATLPPQSLGPQHPCPRHLLTALERGEVVESSGSISSSSSPGRRFSANELFQALGEDTTGGSGGGGGGGIWRGRESLAKELVELLSKEGFLRIDTEDAPTIDQGFTAAQEFFARIPADKRKAVWAYGPGKKHAGWRAEGSRELFAMRDEEGEKGEEGGKNGDGVAGAHFEGGTAAAVHGVVSKDTSLWPCTPWRALYALQRRVARALFQLLALGVGVDLTQDHKDALFGGGGEHREPSGSGGKELREGQDQSQGQGQQQVQEGCCDVMRVYRYLRRPANAPPPGMRLAATSAHCDVGLLTVAPLSTLPGLVLLDPSGQRWVDVESGVAADSTSSTTSSSTSSRTLICFLGEAGARLLAQGINSSSSSSNVLRAPVHFVMEKGGGAVRYSAPFFLRATSTALLAPGLTNADFLQSLALRPWARLRDRDSSPVKWASDF